MTLQNLHDSIWPLEKPNIKKDDRNVCTSKEIMNELLPSKGMYKIRYYCELGSNTGNSLLYACERLPKETMLFAVDIWPSDSDILTQVGKKFENKCSTLYETFLVNCWDHKEKIIPLRMTMIEGLEQIYNLNIPLDLIYVDVSYKYEYAKDIILTSLRLFPNAVIYGNNYLKIRQVILDIAKMKSFKVYVHACRTWMFNRNLKNIGLREPPSIMQSLKPMIFKKRS